MLLLKKLKPNKRRVLTFLFLFLIIPTYFLIYLLLGGSIITGDRGHESYSATKTSELYSDITEPIMAIPVSILGLPYQIGEYFHIDLLESGFNYKFGIIITTVYLYVLACLLESFYSRFQRKLRKPEKHEKQSVPKLSRVAHKLL